MDFLLGVSRRFLPGFGGLVFQELEAGAGVLHPEATFADQEVAESTKDADFKVDGAGRNFPVVRLAFLCRAFDFEVVNVSSGDGFDEFPFPEVSLEVFQDLGVVPYLSGLSGEWRRTRSANIVMASRVEVAVPASGFETPCHLSGARLSFILLPALRFDSFAGCLSGKCPAALLALPPFNEKIAGAFVLDLTIPNLTHGDELPNSGLLTDFFDDAFLESHHFVSVVEKLDTTG